MQQSGCSSLAIRHSVRTSALRLPFGSGRSERTFWDSQRVEAFGVGLCRHLQAVAVR